MRHVLSKLPPTARAVAERPLPPDMFPIADPDLARLSELLHRMTVCQEDTPATRMAGEAIGRLRAYLLKNEGK